MTNKINIISLIVTGVLLLTTIILYILFGFFGIVTNIAFILMLLSIVIYLILNRKAIGDFFKKSGSVTGVYKIFQFIIVVGILVFLYLISDTLPFKIDLTTSRLFSLSEETEGILKELTNDLQIKYFKSIGMQGPLVDYQEGLLKTYVQKSPHIKMETIDPDYNRAVAIDYNIKEPGMVVFELGGNNIYVGINKIFENDQNSGKLIYKGEIEYTTAIKSLLSSKPKNVFVLSGHSEIIPADNSEKGYKTIFETLQQDNIQISSLNLSKATEIPPSCSLLIIGNPKQIISPDELDMINNYVNNGGSILVLLEMETQQLVNDILRQMGLFYLKNMVFENEYYNPKWGQHIIIPRLLSHDVTRPLLRNNLSVVLPTAVAIQQLPESKRVDRAGYFIHPLLKTSDNSFAEMSEAQIRAGKMTLDESDIRGPLFTAYAVRKVRESIINTRDSSETNVIESRLVVIGDADFINNSSYFIGGNSDFFQNAVNYLLKRESAITIRPKTSEIVGFQLESSASRFLSILAFSLGFLYLIPGIVIIIRRRSKVKGA